MAALREILAKFGFEFDHAGADKAHKETDRLKEAAEGLVAVFAGSELVRGVGEFAEQLAHTGELAEQLNVGTDELQLFQYAAEVSGSSTEELNASLTLLQKSLGHTEAATSEQSKALTDLGIATKDAAGAPRDLNEILPQVFDNFTSLTSEAKEAEVATALFGRSGVKLLPTLRQGKEGLAKLKEEMQEFGGPVSAETIEAGKVMADNVKRLDHAWFNLKASLGAQVLPQFGRLVEVIGKGVARFSDWVKGTTIAENAVWALAAVIAGPLLMALGPFIGPALEFIGIFLAVDDVIGFLQGKDSLIGRLLDAAFGEGTSKGVQDWVKGVVAAFAEVTGSGVSIFHALGSAWGDTINDMITAFDSMILSVDQGWNSLIDTLHLPDALKIDTTSREQTIARDHAVHDAYGQMAYEDMHPDEVAKTIHGGSDEETSYGVRADSKEKMGKGAIRSAFASPDAGAPDYATAFNPLAHVGEPKVFAPGGQNYLSDFLGPTPGIAAPPIGYGGAPSVAAPQTTHNTTTITVQAPTTVQVPPGTSPNDAAAFARANQKAAQGAYRAAAQALVPRAP